MNVEEDRGSFLPFALPEIGEEEIAEVVDTLRSGWITTGPKVRQFENEFSEFLGGGVEAISVNSATAGLHLALEAVGIAPGDEVITTTYTFTATAEVVQYLGGRPVFVDIDPRTMNIDTDAIESAITSRTRAILPVHFAGLAANMDKIHAIAHKHNLRVIEDAAHALPTTWKKNLIGTLASDATVFSFYATKTLATGEGGMLLTHSPEIASRCKVMRLHGIDRDAFNRYTSTMPAWFYRVVAPGYKYNMTDIAAAIGIQQLKKINAFQRKRHEMAMRYSEAFKDLCLRRPSDAPAGETHAWHLYVVRLDEDAPVTRDEFIQRVSDAGIGTSVHFIPLHLQPYWKDTYGLRAEDYPRATRAFRAAVSLPIYTRMTEDDQQRVIEAVRSILSGPSRPTVALAGTGTAPVQ